MLSTKHSQQTDSTSIELGDDFDKYFELSSSGIGFADNLDIDDDVSIILGDVVIEETDDSIFYYTKKFDVVDADGVILAHIEEQNGANLYLTDTMVALYNKAKDKTAPISVMDIDDSESLFVVEVSSKEVMGPIKLIRSILTNNSHGGAKNLDELHQIFAASMMSVGIKYDFVHGECILRSIIRKKSDITQFPDWGRNGDHSDYQIIQIHSALMNNPSPLIRLSAGYMKSQLQSTDLYKVSGASHIDAFFVEQLSDVISD